MEKGNVVTADVVSDDTTIGEPFGDPPVGPGDDVPTEGTGGFFGDPPPQRGGGGGGVVSVRGPDGTTTTVTSNDDGSKTKTVTDEDGNVISTEELEPTETSARITNPDGTSIEQWRAGDHKETVTYDEHGNEVRTDYSGELWDGETYTGSVVAGPNGSYTETMTASTGDSEVVTRDENGVERRTYQRGDESGTETLYPDGTWKRTADDGNGTVTNEQRLEDGTVTGNWTTGDGSSGKGWYRADGSSYETTTKGDGTVVTKVRGPGKPPATFTEYTDGWKSTEIDHGGGNRSVTWSGHGEGEWHDSYRSDGSSSRTWYGPKGDSHTTSWASDGTKSTWSADADGNIISD